MVFVLIALINMRHLLAATKKMSNVAAILVAGLTTFIVFPVKAQFTLAPLSGSEIRSELIGSNLIGEYTSGENWSETLKSNMTSLYKDAAGEMSGLVKVNGSILCFTYPSSNNPQPHCFEIWKRGANCFDFYGATSSSGLQDKRFGRGWLARAWRVEQPSTCQSDLIG